MVNQNNLRNIGSTDITHGQNSPLFYTSNSKKSEFEEFLEKHNYTVMERFILPSKDNHTPKIAFDLNLRLLFLNSATKKDFYIDSEDQVGSPLDLIIPIAQKLNNKEFESSWEELIREGILIGFQLKRTVALGNGLTLPLNFIGSPLFNQHGELLGGALFYRILTGH